MGIRCRIFGHETTQSIEFDIPLHPFFIDDKYMKDGFVKKEWTKCTRCHKLLNTEMVEVTDDD